MFLSRKTPRRQNLRAVCFGSAAGVNWNGEHLLRLRLRLRHHKLRAAQQQATASNESGADPSTVQDTGAAGCPWAAAAQGQGRGGRRTDQRLGQGGCLNKGRRQRRAAGTQVKREENKPADSLQPLGKTIEAKECGKSPQNRPTYSA